MGQKNSNKGNFQPERTPQEDAQIQQVLTQYRQIAKSLGTSRSEKQIGAVLSPIFDLSHATQIGLLKALAKENTTAAADIALAINTYAPQKEVRKEARRSLIRLEGKNTYPEWQIPTVLSLSDVLETNVFDEEDDVLDGENVVEHFLNHWGEGEFEAAYNLLSASSPLREGLSSDEWVVRRQAWAAEAEPALVKVDVGYGLEADVEDLPDSLDNGAEELDAFWSLTMKDVPGSSSIPELPTATLVLPATGRHWFWAGYTFLVEDDELRILSIRDKGAEALQLSEEEIEERLQEIAEEIQGMSEELEEDDEEDVEDEDDEDENELDDDKLDMYAEEVVWFTKQSLHYCDALIARIPENDGTYKLASQQAVVIHDMERAAAYVALAVERFPEQRGETLRSLGAIYAHLAEDEYIEDEDIEDTEDTVSSRFTSLAEQALRDAIAIDNAVSDYVHLAELLMEQDKQDEAAALLEQAGTLTTEPQEQAIVEVGKAQLARIQDKPEVALAHYQRVAELAPDLPAVWYSIGDIQLSLQRGDAATKSFLKSIEVDPTTTDAYADLATIYIDQGNDTAALKILERGLAENPFAADLLAAQAMIYISKGDLRKAEESIEEAEESGSDMEIVQVVRQVIDMQKEQLRQQQRSPGSRSKKSKKRR